MKKYAALKGAMNGGPGDEERKKNAQASKTCLCKPCDLVTLVLIVLLQHLSQKPCSSPCKH